MHTKCFAEYYINDTNGIRKAAMQSEESTASASEFHLFAPGPFNPVVTFGFGLLMGSIIGINGVILLALGGAAYYYKDNIVEGINSVKQQSSDVTQVQSSWLEWGKGWIPGLKPQGKRKKTE